DEAVERAEGLLGPNVEAAFVGEARRKLVDDERAGDEEEERGEHPEADRGGAVVSGGGDPAGAEDGGDVEQQDVPEAHGLAQLGFGGGRIGGGKGHAVTCWIACELKSTGNHSRQMRMGGSTQPICAPIYRISWWAIPRRRWFGSDDTCTAQPVAMPLGSAFFPDRRGVVRLHAVPRAHARHRFADAGCGSRHGGVEPSARAVFRLSRRTIHGEWEDLFDDRIGERSCVPYAVCSDRHADRDGETERER